MTIQEQLAGLIADALQKAQNSGKLPAATVPAPTLEMPRNRAHGDWACNIALVLAPQVQQKPRDVAQTIVDNLPIGGASPIASVDIAGPGFLNFRLQPGWLGDILRGIRAASDTYGQTAGTGESVLVEFVSANPNGPITVAHGRNAAVGDCVANLLTATGLDVKREHYVNDALNSKQMNSFGLSVFVRYKQLLGQPAHEFADMYQGDYVYDVARHIMEQHGPAYEHLTEGDPQTAQTFRALSQDGMIAQQAADLAAFGIRFDTYFQESHLFQTGQVSAAIDALTQSGHTFQQDGALWLRSTDYGDDKDRVILRADGTATYIAGDAAYHKDKFDRGFAKLVNVWGADHAGYVARTKAVIAALGYDPAKLHVLLYQLVRIMKDGEFVKSSKRKGDVLELKADLIDEIGSDAARFFFLMRSPNTDLDIDLDLAKKTERDNPVYYVQYAHARIVQTLERALTEKAIAPGDANLDLLTQDSEGDLIKKLSDFPGEVRQAASEYAPQRITQYARDLASLFHTFYDAGNRDPLLRVVCDDVDVCRARLVLIDAARVTLKNALALLGVSAPDRM